MTREQIKEKIESLVEKVDDIIISVTFDEDEIADIFIDKNNHIFINELQTPYNVEDIDKIKYHHDQYEREPDYIKFFIRNGESIIFDNESGYGVYLKVGNDLSWFGSNNPELTHRFNLLVKAREMGLHNNDLLIVDNTLLTYNGNKKDIVIPEGVEVIEAEAFTGTDIESVVFPSSLKSIKYACFRFCKCLKNVEFNEGLETIDDLAFCACYLLKEIKLPKSIKYIHESAFDAEINII